MQILEILMKNILNYYIIKIFSTIYKNNNLDICSSKISRFS